MNKGKKKPFNSSIRGRKSSKNTYTTKSGQTIKINRSLPGRMKNWRENWAQKKALRLSGMPKSRIKRLAYRLEPKHLYHYWFSKEGAIMALKLAGIGIVVCFILLVGAYSYLRKDLPAITNIYGQSIGGSIDYYDRTGKVLLWQDYDAVKRVPVPSNQITPYIKNATVSIEDKNFYHEGAYDVGAILRSGYHDVFHSNQGIYGASTITEQLVKLNESWNGNRGVLTKIKEVLLASDLERSYSKDQILTAYLNIAPYGGVDYGVQTAAQDYFHTSAQDLTLAQSAMLAAIPQSPSLYSPYSQLFNQSALLTRQRYILSLMQEQGYITETQEKQAAAVDVLAQVQPEEGKYNNIIAPYFVLTAKQQLENQFGTSSVEQGGWKVITTLNLPQQELAQKVVADDQSTVESYGGDDAALVAENVPTAQVTALVGGFDFNNPVYGQINFATTLIPPGSSYKLYDYTTLINDQDDVGAGSVLYDVQQPLPGYPCTNKALPLDGGNCLEDYDFRYPGAETVRYALAGSRNVPAVKAMLIAGEQKVIKTSEEMGLTDGYHCYANTALTVTAPCYSSAAIGDGAYLRLYQHVNGFATDARLGKYIPQTFILKVTSASGKTIYQWHQPKGTQVVRQDSAYIIDNILSDPDASYLPSYQKIQHFTNKYGTWDFAVKTGTQNNNYDGLMMAFSTQWAIGTWVGYHTGDVAMTAGGMEDMTTPMVKGWMDAVHQNLKPVNWVQPSDIKVLPSFVQTTHVGLGSIEPGPSTDLYPSWYVQPSSSKKSYTVDIVSDDLATSCTPPLAKKVIGSSYNANAFSIDPFYGTGSSSSTLLTSQYHTNQYDTIHQCSDQHPIVTLQSSSSPPCNNGSCTIGINVAQGTHPLSSSSFPMKIYVLIGGQTIPASCTFTPYISTSNPPNASSGSCSFSYSGSGSHSGTVEVVDSVLYTGTSPTSFTIDTPAITSPSNGGQVSVNNANISWTSSDAGASFTVKIGGVDYCTNTYNQNCQITGGLSPNTSYTVQIIDNQDQETSPSVTFTTSSS